MDADTIYNNILKNVGEGFIETSTMPRNTKKPLWYKVYADDGIIYVDKATRHQPSSNISNPRRISRKDFSFVHSYYNRWAEEEIGIRHEVSRSSRNTTYIFGLINKFG